MRMCVHVPVFALEGGGRNAHDFRGRELFARDHSSRTGHHGGSRESQSVGGGLGG